MLRTSGHPADLAPAVHAAVREADPGLVADSVATLDDRVLRTLARPRLSALLLGSFAVCALAIAAVGLFGVLSYIVALRSREIAVRSALGARQAQVVFLVVRQGLRLTLAGVAIGLAGSAIVMRAIASQLFGVSPFDPATYALATALLLLVAAIACAAPARLASRLDPIRVLRNS
jgi:ABC-type antimicrobial peptide transport system permease subunit